MIEHAKTFLEHKAFGVCEWWAHKLNIKTEQVRLSFIYLGFVTAGLNVVAYLVMAFVLEHRSASSGLLPSSVPCGNCERTG
ncbi:MAG: PspC family transcriptional regulator [Flavobacteriales bacterium]|nr:PspC family transcriptional regulator [Flavobacteriales bacterium]